jgi:hypothetical protein
MHVVDRLKPFKRADFDRAEPIKAGGFNGLVDGIGNAVVAVCAPLYSQLRCEYPTQ